MDCAQGASLWQAMATLVRGDSVPPSGWSDRILFRKDWDHLALAVQAVRVVEPSVYYERAKRASRARGILQCRCLVVYHPKDPPHLWWESALGRRVPMTQEEATLI